MTLFSRNWLTGHESWPVRLWRIRFRHAVAICLPFWFILLWYIALPIFDHIAYNQAMGASVPLDDEIFHLHLYDQLQRDVRRFGITPAGQKSNLPRLEILMSNEQLDKLDAGSPPAEGKTKYAQGLIRKGSRLYKAKLRYRGYKHWNWNYAQKSWKIRLDDELLMGQQTFSFVNPAGPVPFLEQIVLEIARKNGLLTPDYFPIRLRLNGSDMGVYWFMGQPDEFLLRRHERIPGDIYSGNRAGSLLPSGASALFWNPMLWKKPARRHEGQKERRENIKILLDAIQNDAGFAEFARAHLDLSKFALLEALDIVFGCSQHNWDQDHKLYFDPYRGRWEPIAWDFRRFEHLNSINIANNPLQLRLRELPEYMQLRHHWLATLLYGDASPTAITKAAEQFYARLAPEFATDTYWDAYGLLPGISTYYRQWVRPMNAKWARRALDAALATLRRRSDMLHARIMPEVQAFLDAKPGGFDTLHLLVHGEAPVKLRKADMLFDAPCPTMPAFAADWNGNGRVDAGEPAKTGASVTPGDVLVPGWRALPLIPVTESRGTVRLTPEPRRYDYLLPHAASCRLRRVTLTLEAENTPAWNLEVLAQTLPDSAQLAPGPGFCDPQAPPAAAGRRAPHPWCLKLEPRTIYIGPGEILVGESQTFGPETTVIIRPGTRFRMRPGTSLFFFGPVLAAGTPNAPIEWHADDLQKPWGGVSVQGSGTKGAVFSHIRVSGGSSPVHALSEYPAMFNVHDTRDIRISHAIFQNSRNRGDALHAAYVQNLRMEDCTIENASADAVDIEFVTGRILRLSVRGAGDECVDSMGSSSDIEDARLADCGGNAVSAGERSRLQIRRTAIVQSGTGLLAKNNSDIDCNAVILYKTKTGVRIEKKEIRYEGASRVKGRDLYILETGRVFSGPPKRLAFEESELQLDLRDIAHVLPIFPGIRNLEELHERLDALSAKGLP